MKVKQFLPTKLLVLLTILTWVLSILLALPPLIGWSSYEAYENISCSISTKSANGGMSYILAGSFFGLLLPFSVVIGLNAIILHSIRRLNRKQPINPTVSIFLIAAIVIFVIIWSPLAVCIILDMGWNSVPPEWNQIVNLITKSGVLTEPILFIFLNKRFIKNTKFSAMKGFKNNGWNQKSKSLSIETSTNSEAPV